MKLSTYTGKQNDNYTTKAIRLLVKGKTKLALSYSKIKEGKGNWSHGNNDFLFGVFREDSSVMFGGLALVIGKRKFSLLKYSNIVNDPNATVLSK